MYKSPNNPKLSVFKLNSIAAHMYEPKSSAFSIPKPFAVFLRTFFRDRSGETITRSLSLALSHSHPQEKKKEKETERHPRLFSFRFARSPVLPRCFRFLQHTKSRVSAADRSATHRGGRDRRTPLDFPSERDGVTPSRDSPIEVS